MKKRDPANPQTLKPQTVERLSSKGKAELAFCLERTVLLSKPLQLEVETIEKEMQHGK